MLGLVYMVKSDTRVLRFLFYRSKNIPIFISKTYMSFFLSWAVIINGIRLSGAASKNHNSQETKQTVARSRIVSRREIYNAQIFLYLQFIVFHISSSNK